VIKEARKEDILAIANLAVRCLRLNGKKMPTMNNPLHIKYDQESVSDEQSFQHSSNGIFSLSSQMESTSFLNNRLIQFYLFIMLCASYEP
jgi:hypothetical protein